MLTGKVTENNQKVWNSVLAECKPLMVSLGNLEEQLRAFQKIQNANTALHNFPDLHQHLHFKLLQAADIVLGAPLISYRCSLQSVRDAISNQVSGAFQLYEQNIDTGDLFSYNYSVCPAWFFSGPVYTNIIFTIQVFALIKTLVYLKRRVFTSFVPYTRFELTQLDNTLATCTQRFAVAPSIADMLEWLQDAERYYPQQYPFCVTVSEKKECADTLRADDLSLLETAPKRWESLKTMSEEESISSKPIYGALFSIYTVPSES
ncbi:uncharacterized protein C1orf109-like, partial [Coregonus clupeaformis]|uniref:uncharacterized protein C1orf109-like n=1 Tax=Coregonus clupeaformis TaxID=59861 RepID=UPI001E1C8DD1